MKMLYVSLSWLLIVIIIWALFYYLSIEKTIDYFENELSVMRIALSSENYNDAQVSLNKLLDYWKKTEKLWIYFVHQGDVDEIGACLLKMDVYIKTENISMALSEIEELRITMRMVQGNESLSFENIF